jgi:uncharacterized protein YlxW (UPF0749 family)
MPATTTGGPARGPEQSAPSARERLNLIDQLTAAAVASDYAVVAGQAPSRSRRERVLVAAAALALAGFVLALGVSDRVLNDPVVNDQRTALLERIDAADSRNDELIEQVADARVELSAAREQSLQSSLAGARLAAEIQALELATGYAPVEGPGAVVTLTDAPVDDAAPREDLEQVLDSDIQRAVNGLWSVGAEAIAVNGQRLTARSAIRSAAGAILVNYRPLKPPYQVEAIGPPDLADRFWTTQDAQELLGVSAQFGIGLEASSVGRLTLRSATSPLPSQSEVVRPGEPAQSEGEGEG